MAGTVSREVVLDWYKKVLAENPRCTLSDVQEAMAKAGLKNTATGRPWSLSTIHYALQRHPEALNLKSKNNVRKVLPVLVMMKDYPLVSKWLADNIKGEAINEDDLTIAAVKGRPMYGWTSPAFMVEASKVWWPFKHKHGALITDQEIDDTIRFQLIEVKKPFPYVK